jgi:hypothetical protein
MARVSSHFAPVPTHDIESTGHHIVVSGDFYPAAPTRQVAQDNIKRHPVDESRP